MNQEKFKRIKGLINRADCIKNELLILNYFEPINDDGTFKVDYSLLFDDGISEEEKFNFINNLGERLSYICELYLKALLLPNMHFDGIDIESDEELDEIFNGRRGIKKKYSHFFSKMLSSTQTHLPEKLRENILIELSKLVHDDTSKRLGDNYTNASLDSFLNDNESIKQRERTIKEQLVANSIQLTDNNSDAYPQSRYSMFTDYIADIDYLFNLSNILRDNISLYIPCCLYEAKIGRHIFPDPDSHVTVKLNNGKEGTYYVDSSGNINKFNFYKLLDLYPDSNSSLIVEVDYIEDGEEKHMKYDNKRHMFVQYNKQILVDSKEI